MDTDTMIIAGVIILLLWLSGQAQAAVPTTTPTTTTARPDLTVPILQMAVGAAATAAKVATTAAAKPKDTSKVTVTVSEPIFSPDIPIVPLAALPIAAGVTAGVLSAGVAESAPVIGLSTSVILSESEAATMFAGAVAAGAESIPTVSVPITLTLTAPGVEAAGAGAAAAAATPASGGAVASDSATTTSLLSAGPITMGISIAIAAVIVILSLVLKGADPLQVPAAMIEQIFEAAADNLYALAKAGIISIKEALAGIAAFTEAAIEYEQKMAKQYNHPKPFGAAITNVTKVNNAEAAAVQKLPVVSVSTAAISVGVAKAAFYTTTLRNTGQVRPGRWYSESIDAAEDATWQYLKTLPRSKPMTIPAPLVTGQTPSPVTVNPSVATTPVNILSGPLAKYGV